MPVNYLGFAKGIDHYKQQHLNLCFSVAVWLSPENFWLISLDHGKVSRSRLDEH